MRVGLTFLAGEGGKACFGHALLEQFGESLLATKAFVALEERTVAWLLQSAIAAQEDDVWAACRLWATARQDEADAGEKDTAAPAKWQDFLRPLVPFIRFPLVSARIFDTEVVRSGLLHPCPLSC